MGKILLILIFITGIILRFSFLERMSFWMDELKTIEFADPLKSAGQIIYRNLTLPEQSPPLFNLILHAWFKAVPLKPGLYPSEAWIRFLPALLSLFSLLLLIRIFVFPWQGRISLAAYLVFCLSSFYLYFSREVRPYGLTLLMTLLSTWAFLKFLDSHKKIYSIIYSLSLWLGVLSNPFIWFVSASHLIYLFIKRDKDKLGRLIILSMPSLMVYIPYTLIILKHFRRYEWPSRFAFFVLKKIAGLFFHVTLGFNFPTNVAAERYNIFLRDPLFLSSLLIILLICVFSIIKWPRICRGDRLAFLSFIQVIVPLILAFLIYPRRIGPRTLGIIAPFFHYLLVKGIFFKEVPRLAKAIGLVFLVMVIFFGFRFITFKVNPYIPEDWRGLADQIRLPDQAGVVFIMSRAEEGLLQYYLDAPEVAKVITYDSGSDSSIWSFLQDYFNTHNCRRIVLLKMMLAPYSSLHGPFLSEAIFDNLMAQFKLVNIQFFGDRISLCTFTKNVL